MHNTNPGEAGAVGTASVFGQTNRILPNEHTQHKHRWLTICRAWRSDDDWTLVYQHRARLGAYLNNAVELAR